MLSQSFSRAVSAISAESLVHLISSNVSHRIFDVRDTDYGSKGVIKNHIHLPYSDFTPETSMDVAEECMKDKIDHLVFYCQHGQARSVRCAQEVQKDCESIGYEPEVSYLKGGVSLFSCLPASKSYVINHTK